jgi:hypothetical protein
MLKDLSDDMIKTLCDQFRSVNREDVELSLELLGQVDINSLEQRQLKRLENCIQWSKVRADRFIHSSINSKRLRIVDREFRERVTYLSDLFRIEYNRRVHSEYVKRIKLGTIKNLKDREELRKIMK